MQQYSDVVLVTDVPGGQVRAPAAATVQVNISGGAIATIYSDDGVTPKTNPITCDSSGEYSFYAADGVYDLTIAVTGYTTETKTAAVMLFDSAGTSVLGDVTVTSLKTGNGSASAPSIAGTNFTTTGLYWATGKLEASLAGTRALELNADSFHAGVNAGNATTSATGNILLGLRAGRLLTTGSSNVVIGSDAGRSGTAWFDSIVIGHLAGFALQDGDGITTGGFQEVLIGEQAGLSITTGPNNTMVGSSAGKQTTTGGSNTFVGRASANANQTGGFNTAVGHATGFQYTSGSSNTWIGNQAGNAQGAGVPITGSFNVAVGELSGSTVIGVSSTLCLGTNAVVTASSTGKIGSALTDITLSGRGYAKRTRQTNATAGGTTLSTADFLGPLLLRTGAGAGYSDTIPAASAIVSAIPGCEVGSGYVLAIRNTSGGTITLLVGAGITLSGTTTIGNGNTRLYNVEVTNVGTPAVLVTGFLEAVT